MNPLSKPAIGCLLALFFQGAALAQDAPAKIEPPAAIETTPPAILTSSDSPTRTGFIAGASLYLLKPYFGGNPAFVTTTGAGTPSPASTTTDFDWKFNATPAFWLGWIGDNGFGMRTNFFYVNQSSQDQSFFLAPGTIGTGTTTIAGPSGLNLPPAVPPVVFGAPGVLPPLAALFGATPLGNNFSFTSDVRIDSWDVEALYDIQIGRWTFLFAGGGRYLHLAQNYHATMVSTADLGGVRGIGTATETQTLSVSRSFNGGGPTAAFQSAYQLGNCGLSVFGVVRGSLVVGSSSDSSSFSQTISDPSGLLLGGANVVNTGSANSGSRSLVIPIAEIDLGVEYGRAIRGNYGFFRAGVVNKTYFNSGSASQTNGDLSLFGVQFSLGLNY